MTGNVEKDINNIEIDFTKVRLERGETPVDIKDTCFALCRDYLGGVWLQLTIDEVVVNRLSGGLTNQLYYCAVNEEHRRSDAKEPQEVAIRLYGEKHFNKDDNEGNERLTDVIIGLMVSQNNLGPKIYGVFERGQIQRYYKHKNFRIEEQKDPKLVEEVARKMAQIHAMDVPIRRTKNWIFDFFDNSYKKANELFDLKTLYEESNCVTFKAYNLWDELQWMKTAIDGVDSPKTFTHVDFRGSNIMITESDGIVLCDFEYSCYDCRGYDFGTIFFEWNKELLQFNDIKQLPDDETITSFIEIYIEESVKLLGNGFTDDNRNTIQHILKEVKLFILVANLFIILFLFKMNESIIEEIPFDKKQMMMRCDIRYKNYRLLKQKLIDDKVIEN